MIKKLVIFLARIKRTFESWFFKNFDELFNTDYYPDVLFKYTGYYTSDYRFNTDQIAFVHLPKTGGTTFYKMLQESEKVQFVNLKIHLPVSEHCDPKTHQYITILRHPVDRVWSYFQMVLRQEQGYPYRKFAIKGLKPFLENCSEVRNGYCRYFSGLMKKEPDQSISQKAQLNLSNFYAVLFFENFNTEVEAFLSDHGLPFKKIIHERKSSYDFPNDEEKALIASYNKLDLELYEKWLQIAKQDSNLYLKLKN